MTATTAGRGWIFNTETLVPVSFVLVLAAAIFWSGAIYLQVQQNTEMITELNRQRSALDRNIFDQMGRERDYLRTINMRLSRIEGKLEEIKPTRN